ncbi:hypothetical protein ACFPRL_32805 [Pseudoclavibacter helvolus]
MRRWGNPPDFPRRVSTSLLLPRESFYQSFPQETSCQNISAMLSRIP